MGLVVNQVARHLSLEELLIQLDIVNDDGAIRLPSKVRDMSVHKGGRGRSNAASCCIATISC